jgi:hypothetical protein
MESLELGEFLGHLHIADLVDVLCMCEALMSRYRDVPSPPEYITAIKVCHFLRDSKLWWEIRVELELLGMHTSPDYVRTGMVLLTI